jgi:hypothetical protein
LVFAYIWPERTIDRFRDALRAALRQLAKLLEIPQPKTSIEEAKSEAHGLIGETSKSFDQARRYLELTEFESEESPNGERTSLGNLETTLSSAEHVLTLVTSLTSDSAWNEWQKLPPEAQAAESELRNIVARRLERATASDTLEDADANLSTALARWTEMMQALHVKNSRVPLLSQIVTEVQQLKSIPN